jgi:hypothetical protein
MKPAVILGYLLLTLALLAEWEQDSVWGISAAALFILALTALESEGFAVFKAGGPNLNIEIQKVQTALEKAATAAAIAEGSSGEPAAGGVEYRGGIGNKALGPNRPDFRAAAARKIEANRRVAIEQLIKDGAVWGWMMSNVGFKTPPIPTIEWDYDGQAHITYGTGETDPRKLEALARRLRGLQQKQEPSEDDRGTGKKAQ